MKLSTPEGDGRADRIMLSDFHTVPMRTFHITWFTFFLCFFSWFALAPLIPVIREELDLTRQQVGNIVIGSVLVTVFARLFFGWLCDRIGPRRSYFTLLLISSFPVMAIGLSDSYESLLLFRMAIGITGASFVITQYHTSAMFAPRVVGTASAMVAGWGNMGGGVTLMAMPLVFSAFIAAGCLPDDAWRLSMVIPGVALFAMAFVYYFFTRDTPSGEHRERKKADARAPGLLSICRDYRVWILFVAYGACFGVEITIDNIATLYFIDTFDLELRDAGFIAGLFGMMNLFARALGGLFGDRAGNKYGLNGRVYVLGALLLAEGAGLYIFASAATLPWAIGSMLLFALFLKMSNGATYAVVPFINPGAIGLVSGVVGAGGNVFAILAGFLLTTPALSYRSGFIIMASAVTAAATMTLLIVSRRLTFPETTGDLPREAFPDLKTTEGPPVGASDKLP